MVLNGGANFRQIVHREVGREGGGGNLFVEKWNKRQMMLQVICHWLLRDQKRFRPFYANCGMFAR